MPDNEAYLLVATSRTPWNKGKLIGAKPPLRPKHVWAIRTRHCGASHRQFRPRSGSPTTSVSARSPALRWHAIP